MIWFGQATFSGMKVLLYKDYYKVINSKLLLKFPYHPHSMASKIINNVSRLKLLKCNSLLFNQSPPSNGVWTPWILAACHHPLQRANKFNLEEGSCKTRVLSWQKQPWVDPHIYSKDQILVCHLLHYLLPTLCKRSIPLFLPFPFP